MSDDSILIGEILLPEAAACGRLSNCQYISVCPVHKGQCLPCHLHINFATWTWDLDTTLMANNIPEVLPTFFTAARTQVDLDTSLALHCATSINFHSYSNIITTTVSILLVHSTGSKLKSDSFYINTCNKEVKSFADFWSKWRRCCTPKPAWSSITATPHTWVSSSCIQSTYSLHNSRHV